MKIQAHILYSGMVQGVGFRYTVQRLAESLNLYGWVKNLSDGRVEIAVVGEEETIGKLMKKIQENFKGYIKDVQKNVEPHSETFHDFRIRF